MTKWFIQSAEEHENLGPLPPSELLQMVRNGEVTRQTKLRRDGETAWFTANDVGGLFEAAMRPTIQYLCPECETEVDEPPAVCHHCGHHIRQAVTTITENTIINRTDPPSEDQPGPVSDLLRKKRIAREKDTDAR